MLRQRHRHDDLDTEISVAAEEQIREDERRKVLAELAKDRHDDDQPGSDADRRSAPPPVGEEPVADPVETAPDDARTATSDPRRFDVPDDRWEDGRRDERFGDRDADVVTTGTTRVERTDEVPVAAPVAVDETTVTERGFSPGQILIALAGAATLVLGIIAVVRTGLGDPLTEPVEPVLGWDHTAVLGLIEIGAGVVLLLASLRAGLRWIGGLIGLAMIAGGVLIVGQFDDDVDGWIADHLAAERQFGWVAIGIGAVAVIGAAIPRIRRTREVTTTQSTLT